jgi:hypothetical protein
LYRGSSSGHQEVHYLPIPLFPHRAVDVLVHEVSKIQDPSESHFE